MFKFKLVIVLVWTDASCRMHASPDSRKLEHLSSRIPVATHIIRGNVTWRACDSSSSKLRLSQGPMKFGARPHESSFAVVPCISQRATAALCHIQLVHLLLPSNSVCLSMISLSIGNVTFALNVAKCSLEFVCRSSSRQCIESSVPAEL